ncbi:proline-rich receptor-like protein kinase PERK14 [Hevea brasiliensis]|uniref:proline-rich receptor-like protein kinase PERK14 n=1 Tax=Hevea brasiliensis TaxID=3981 RepID=UPI0025FFAD51|nr:proline-rich receptor-like protein kinase PERK14 [Hevea brasiliensis]
MATPSSPSANPNPSPSPPPLSQSPPQTPPLPQSSPPSSPPLPQNQTPTHIPPTPPLTLQNEAQNETSIFETQIQEPMPKPAPTQAKSKAKAKMTAGRPKKAPVGKRKGNPSVSLDFNSSPQVSSEPVSKRTRSSSSISSPVAPIPQHADASGSAEPSAFAPAEPQAATAQQFSANILSILRSLESKVASFTAQPFAPSPDTTDILATLKSLEVKIDTMASDHNETTAEPGADPDAAIKP